MNEIELPTVVDTVDVTKDTTQQNNEGFDFVGTVTYRLHLLSDGSVRWSEVW